MHNDMFNKAKKRMEEKTYECHNMDEIKEVMENHPGFIKAMWCGEEECEDGVKAASYIILDFGAGAAEPPTEIIDFILDRPFVFAITNRSIPMFVGTVNNP